MTASALSARILAAGFCWSTILISGAVAQPAASLRPTQAPAQAADQVAAAALRARPWYASFKTVLADTNAIGRDKFDPAFGEGWTETEALGEAIRRIEAGARDGRIPTAGAINDAVDLGAANLVGRAGCFAGLMQRTDFSPQLGHLSALRIDGQLPDGIRTAVKEFAQGPCEAPQSAGSRNFDPRRGWEAGKRRLNNAVAAGAMPPLAKYLEERGHLATVNADEQLRQTREGIAAEFRRFDRLYDGHGDLLRSYQGLFADYCPTDQRFCALRDLMAQWGQPDGYCEQVVKYAGAYYMDTTRLGYLPGAENDGLNRAWEGYHLKFAPACIFLGKRPDLIPAAARRLDVIAPLFASDPNAPGDASIAPIRAALRTVQTNVETLAGHEARVKAYRAAAAGDTRVASINPAQTATDAGPVLPDMPSDDALRAVATAESERQLQLDRLMVRDIQERLLAIGSAVTLSGSMSQSTRGAIRSWQGAVGLEPTGFLTRAQIDLLKIRTQERWVQWRGGRGPLVEAPAPSRLRSTRAERPPRARQQRRYRGPVDRDAGEIPGAIPAYSWRRF